MDRDDLEVGGANKKDSSRVLYTQVTSRCSVQRDDLSSQARQRFEDIVVLH